MLKNNPHRIRVYQGLNAIYCEGLKMVAELENLDLKNVKHMPNFKNYDIQLTQPHQLGLHENTRVKFLYLSRIDQDKGAKLVLDAFERILNSKCEIELQLDFYGVIKPEFETTFFTKLKKLPFARYCGVIDMSRTESYKKLIDEEYRAMLFCTTYLGEGYPGTIIDAMIMGIPVIATDWNMNKETIENNKSGLIVDPGNHQQLDNAIWFFINHPIEAHSMSQYIQSQAYSYHVDQILNKFVSYL